MGLIWKQVECVQLSSKSGHCGPGRFWQPRLSIPHSRVLTLSTEWTADDGLAFQSHPTLFSPASMENRATPWGQAGEGFVLLSSLIILSMSVILIQPTEKCSDQHLLSPREKTQKLQIVPTQFPVLSYRKRNYTGWKEGWLSSCPVISSAIS